MPVLPVCAYQPRSELVILGWFMMFLSQLMFWRNGAMCSAQAVQAMVHMGGETRKLGILLPMDSVTLVV